MSARRWLAPEVVQTSEMDCGPACLKSLVEGFGGRLSYGRLREACQTDVDGTSIDTLEDVGVRLGLQCEQVLVPPDQVLEREQGHLPCLAVVRQPDGEPHFVVIWRRHKGLVQVMDPGFGRRWMSAARLESELYVHALALPAETWRAWAESPAFVEPLERRLRALGVADGGTLVEQALADPSWRSLATLDAVARAVEELGRAGALVRARRAPLFAKLWEAALAAEDPRTLVPERWWMAQAPAQAAGEGEPEALQVRGAVLVRVQGYDPSRVERGALSRELLAALDEIPTRPGRALLAALRAGGRAAPVAILCGGALAAVALALEALLLRALLDLGASLRLPEQRLVAFGALLCFLLALLLLELPLAALVQSLARRVEAGFQSDLLAKLLRIEPRYFKSRPASDMAERAHGVQRLREVVALGAMAWRALAEIAAITVALLWIAPGSAPWVIALVAACVLPPLFLQKPLIERDLRQRTHGGALARFYLDALLGIVPVATHGCERALRRSHEGLLVQWARAARASVATASGFALLQAVLLHALAAMLVWSELARTREPAQALLLVFWVMSLVWLAEPLGHAARSYPTLRNVLLRLLEPLGAPEDEAGVAGAVAAEPSREDARGVAITLEGVGVQAGGHALLSGIDLRIAAGEQIAVVGASGAGKSSLCGLLLGWLRASEGHVLVDGEELAGARIAALRRRTAWVDPEVQIWNRSLAENVRYGTAGEEGGPGLAELCRAADLHTLFTRLPRGLQTSLGEGGGLVSGGEGQRVRLARALARGGARLVILDEALRGLDREQRGRLLEQAREHWRGATLLHVTHRIEEALGFERVLVIDAGRVVEDGRPIELARAEGTRFHTLLAQERGTHGAWEAATWRKAWLEDGRVEERARCAATI